MKIPVILAQNEVPATIPYGSGNVTGLTQSSQYIAQASTQLSHLAEIIAKTEEAKADHASKIEAAQLKSRMELGAGTAIENLKTTVTDPAEFKQKSGEAIKTAYEEALKSATSNRAKQELAQHLPSVVASQGLAVARHSNDLYIGMVAGAKTETLDNTKISMALLDPDDQEGWQRLFSRGVQAIHEAAPTEGAKKTQADLIEWRSTTNFQLGQRRLRLDPHASIEDLQPHIDPKMYETLEKSRDSAVSRYTSEQARAQSAYDKAILNWRETVERSAENHIAARTLTQDFLDENRETFTSEKLAAYNKALNAQSSGYGPGNPETIARFRIALGNRTDPTVNPRDTLQQLTRAFANGQIGESYGPWATQLGEEISRRENKGQTIQNEKDAVVRQIQERRYSAARSNINTVFGRKTQFDKFDYASEEALSQAQEELDRRALSQGGNEDPYEVWREIMPKYIAQVNSRATSRTEALRTQLAFPDAATLTQNRARLGEQRYYEQARMLEELRAIEREMKRLEIIQNQTAGKTTTTPSSNPRERR